jgi:elongator complex protein 3
MRPASWDRFKFDPFVEVSTLIPLLETVIKSRPQTNRDWRRILKQYRRQDQMFFSKSQMIEGFRVLGKTHPFGIEEDVFLSLIRMKPTRTQSGVAPITVLTKPFPCPGQCIFCPNDVRMPKSYLSNEPGAQRAARNRFDPYAQTWNRLTAFYKMGHSAAKVELIVLGGTWSSYPKAYQVYFITRCFEAVSDFGGTQDPQPYDAPVEQQPDFLDLENKLELTPGPDETINLYNKAVSRHLRAELDGALLAHHESVDWGRLATAHRANETAPARIVGLVIETRPDEVSVAEIKHLRLLGATKVQVGIQNLNDEVLNANRRGHTVAQARAALGLLRQGGFKVQAHWMANLYKATVQSDAEDYLKLFSDKWVCPDELKLYPCSLIPHTELMNHYEAGRWRPYERQELLELLVSIMPQTPEYCRLSRVIRDIPADSMHTDSHGTNFREVAEAEIEKRDLKLQEIRTREVKTRGFSELQVSQRIHQYDTEVAKEYFVQFESGDSLLGFIRLSLPKVSPIFDELEGCAMIREVHVYGQSLSFGEESGARAQHRGLGRSLIEAACGIAAKQQFAALAVISSVGTRGYYRKLGFADAQLYQIKALV